MVFSSDDHNLATRLIDIPTLRLTSSDGVTHMLSGEGDAFVTDVIQAIARHDIRVRDFRTELPTLEDVFLKLTGHGIRD